MPRFAEGVTNAPRVNEVVRRMDGSSLADIRAAVERAEAALGTDDVPGAVRIASEAVSAGLEAPLLLNLAAWA